MSLVKKPQMTEANRATRRANGRKSRGATTPAGKERARASNLRHGYYSVIRDEAIEALGEDPARLRALIDSAYEEWRPQSDYQSALVERTARLLWRMDRAERLQESLAVEQVAHLSELCSGRARTLHVRYADQESLLGVLASSAARPDFYAYPQMVCDFTREFGHSPSEDTQRALELFARLRKPHQFSPDSQPLEGEMSTDSDWLAGLPEEGEEGEFPAALPDLPVAEGAERDPLRQELHDLALDLLRAAKQVWEPMLEKFPLELSTLHRDTMWEEAQPQRQLMLREEESCFRQFWRLTTILTKAQERRQDLGLDEQNSKFRIPDSRKQDSGAGILDSAVGGGEPQHEACSAGVLSRVTVAPMSSPAGAGEDARAAMSKNAGASGDIDENTEEQNGDPHVSHRRSRQKVRQSSKATNAPHPNSPPPLPSPRGEGRGGKG